MLKTSAVFKISQTNTNTMPLHFLRRELSQNRKGIKLLLVMLAIGFSVMPAWAQKPILPDFQADPSARVFGGKLYIYPTHDLPGMQHWDEVDWHVFSTDDMVKWTDHGVIFSLKDITWANKEAGAP